jgi:hypothetical protein
MTTTKKIGIVAAVCCVLMIVAEPWTVLVMLGVLFWMLVLVGPVVLYRRLSGRPSRRRQFWSPWSPVAAPAPPLAAPAPAPPVAGTAVRRCRWHDNKREFATREDAEGFVEWSRRRYAAGNWTGAPMDHAYRCPVMFTDHWHVSSKARRP